MHIFSLKIREGLMRIVEIRERTVPIASEIANAYIDFSKMTLSLVAVTTDAIRDGKPVVGYGFNSNGRYGQGPLMRERFIPRIMAAEPGSLLNAAVSVAGRHVWPDGRSAGLRLCRRRLLLSG
jgi:hypothetical protein